MSTSPRAVAYHRLPTLRPEWSRWWRPLLTVLVALIAYSILVSLLMIGSVLVLTAAGTDRTIGQSLGDPTSPLDVFLQCAFAALLIPSALLAARLGGWRPASLLWSVRGRFRTELLRPTIVLTCAVPLVLALVAVTGGGHPSTGRVVALIAMLVVLVPLQAAGEELMFRGIGQQAIGTWLRHPAWAILIPVPFGLIGRGFHGETLIGAVALALACGLLTWKTGGIELAILLRAASTGAASIAAIFGGAPAPSGLLAIVGIVILATAAITAVDRREQVAPTQPVARPVDLPLPDPIRV